MRPVSGQSRHQDTEILEMRNESSRVFQWDSTLGRSEGMTYALCVDFPQSNTTVTDKPLSGVRPAPVSQIRVIPSMGPEQHCAMFDFEYTCVFVEDSG